MPPKGDEDMLDDQSPLASFSGVARLFPLPNLVLFPQVMQPLHIFEPRYRQMTADALAGDRLIAMVLLQPGWEKMYVGAPPVHSVACLSKIVADQQLDDGRYNLLVRGVGRVLIEHEIPTHKLYRQARMEILPDVSPPGPARDRKYRRRLLRAVETWFETKSGLCEQFRKLLRSNLALATLGDIISFALPLPLEFKQELLEEQDVSCRLGRLLKRLERRVSKHNFPPEFSAN